VTYVLFFTAICPLPMWALFYFLYNTIKGDTTRYQAVWIVGVVLDIYVNLTWGTLMFVQMPNIHRGFLSARMDDLIRTGSGWRKRLAVYLVGTFLEPYDLSNPKQHRTYGEFHG
jgi:hypothetical protein